MPDPAKGTTEDPAAAEKPTAEPVAAVPAEPPKVEEPKRSDDVTTWRGDDFTAAKFANDSRLPAAVEHIGKAYPSSESAAKALTVLLKDEERPIPGNTQGKTQTVQVNGVVALAILEALSRNKTPVAVQTCRELLSGQLKILFVDRQLSNNLLPLLAKRANPAFDDLLFEAVSKPQKFRKKAQSRTDDSYTAEKLREDVIHAISSAGSPELRDRLAAFASDRTISSETAQTIEATIARADLRNRLAQVTMLQSKEISKRTRQALEGAVAANSARALELLIGIPEKLHEPPAPGTVVRPSDLPHDDEDNHRAEYLQLATKLWTPQVDAYIDERLEKGNDIGELPDVLLMLGTMPLPSTRFTLSELLAIHGHRGSQIWNSAGMMNRVTTDPGFLALVKNLYHDRGGRSGKIVRPEEGRTRIDDAAKKDWATSAGELVDIWMRRMYSAHQDKIAAAGEFKPDESALPLKLHKDATIVAQYSLKWPEDIQAELPGITVAPLQVRYVRAVNETYMEKVKSHYQRFAGKTKRGKTQELKAGQWLDSLDSGSTPNSLKSIDIRITSGGKQGSAVGSAKKEELEWVVVEILTVEIPEPKNPDPKRKVD